AALAKQKEVRSVAQQQKRIRKKGQFELFTRFDPTDYLSDLQARYHSQCQSRLIRMLAQLRRVSYDDIELMTLRFPMTSVSDLHHWILRWKICNGLVVEGLRGRARVPQFGRSHYLIWRT